MIHHSFSKLALAALLTLPLATTGCTEGQSPTEPAFDLASDSVTGNSLAAAPEDSRGRGRGGDDGAASNDDNGGNSGKSGKNDDRNKGKRRRGRDDRNGGNGNGNGGENRPRNGQEFEAAVASVNGNAIVLTTGTRVIVDGQTQWIARGDLHSLSEIAGSLSAGDNPRVEGRGTRQGDGSILALTIKAEDER